jgi:hypothetical protein
MNEVNPQPHSFMSANWSEIGAEKPQPAFSIREKEICGLYRSIREKPLEFESPFRTKSCVSHQRISCRHIRPITWVFSVFPARS